MAQFQNSSLNLDKEQVWWIWDLPQPSELWPLQISTPANSAVSFELSCEFTSWGAFLPIYFCFDLTHTHTHTHTNSQEFVHKQNCFWVISCPNWCHLVHNNGNSLFLLMGSYSYPAMCMYWAQSEFLTGVTNVWTRCLNLPRRLPKSYIKSLSRSQNNSAQKQKNFESFWSKFWRRRLTNTFWLVFHWKIQNMHFPIWRKNQMQDFFPFRWGGALLVSQTPENIKSLSDAGICRRPNSVRILSFYVFSMSLLALSKWTCVLSLFSETSSDPDVRLRKTIISRTGGSR